MKRVVVTGSECTGKTTLAAALARQLGTVWVPEFARRFVEQAHRPPVYDDVETIARGQMKLEDELGAAARGMLVLDTDLLSTVIYSHHYFGDCPAWIEEAWSARRGDLYFLADIDVPWSAEPPFRDRGDRREHMQALFRAALTDRDVRLVDLRGAPGERLRLAIEAIGEADHA